MESKAMLDDVLQTVKGMVTNYAYALNEASSEFIYQEFFNEFEIQSSPNRSKVASLIFCFSMLRFMSVSTAEKYCSA